MRRLIVRLAFTWLVVGGVLIYESRRREQPRQTLMILGGCVLLVTGVYAMRERHRKRTDEPIDSDHS